jgi:ATP-dependent DNA helicase RecQ
LNQIEEIPPRRKKSAAGISRSIRKKRHVVIGEAFNSGQSVKNIMAKFSIKQITILDHLFKYLQEGYPLRFDEFFALSTIQPDQKSLVLETFNRLGAELLRPAFNALNKEISYDDLKILRLYYLSKKNLTSRGYHERCMGIYEGNKC